MRNNLLPKVCGKTIEDVLAKGTEEGTDFFNDMTQGGGGLRTPLDRLVEKKQAFGRVGP